MPSPDNISIPFSHYIQMIYAEFSGLQRRICHSALVCIQHLHRCACVCLHVSKRELCFWAKMSECRVAVSLCCLSQQWRGNDMLTEQLDKLLGHLCHPPPSLPMSYLLTYLLYPALPQILSVSAPICFHSTTKMEPFYNPPVMVRL